MSMRSLLGFYLLMCHLIQCGASSAMATRDRDNRSSSGRATAPSVARARLEEHTP